MSVFSGNVLGIGLGLDAGDAGVKALQAAMNKILVRLGYVPIGVDGDVGAATCGALAFLGNAKNSGKVTDAEWASIPLDVMPDVLAACQSKGATMPQKAGGLAPAHVTATTTPTVPMQAGGPGLFTWIALAAVGAGVVYFVMRKR